MDIIAQLEKMLLDRRVLGIGMTVDPADLHAVLVANIGGELTIAEKLEGAEAIVQFLEQNRELPVVVNVEHRSVLWRQAHEELSAENVFDLFSEEVPGGQPGEFLLHFKDQMLSFARIATLRELLSPLSGYEDQVVKVYLSPTSGLTLATYQFKTAGIEQTTVGRFAYQFSGEKIATVAETDPADVTLDGVRIDSAYVLPFAGVACFLNRSENQAGGSYADLRGRYSELFYRRVFLKARIPLLVGLMAVFLINSLVFVQVNKNHEELKAKSSYMQQLDQKLKSIHQYIEENSEVISDAHKSARFSILCDQVGYHTPKGITLTRLSLNPEVSARGKQSEFQDGVMIVEGTAEDPQVFSRWLDRLNGLSWVERIEKQLFQNEDFDSTTGSFQLIIRSNVRNL